MSELIDPEKRAEVKVINKSPHALPKYETEGSVGMDIRAWLNGWMFFNPMERKLVKTGLCISLPMGYEAQIRPRSGLAFSKGLTILNAPATIDSDYRGEIKILMINLSRTEKEIKDGDRIAQLVLAEYRRITWVESDLDETERGEGGFGSTGLK